MASDAPILVALGTSLGDREALLHRAVSLLQATADVQVVAASAIYDTAPMGGVAQNRFLNAALTLQTTLEPEPLLDRLQQVEAACGRTRNERWEDRTLDLDLVLWGERLIDTPRLTVPHPGLHLRRFVLAPAVDIAPGARHPRLRRTLTQLLQALPDEADGCRRVGRLRLDPIDKHP